MWRQVARGFDQRLALVAADNWDSPTCCSDWNVAELVRHAVDAQRFVPKALGASGDIDAEGDDFVDVWRRVYASADGIFGQPASMGSVVQLPFGEMTAAEGLGFPTADLLIHTWDLARAIGTDDRLDLDTCAVVYARLLPLDEGLRGSGFFGPKLTASPDADAQEQLLAFVGRRV